ncbi:peritrophin-48-like [Teleopsis dalmanni]|uniref:peritrophin-48-like n=1 Tax=Teleopsis dalmanni TaxID=139649 RepID=UPI000D32C3B4|nr:peritrophin-48-like [Teleopsis dalmanni]XP_037939896.1 peritrophin-48-like [Teleopsis dalmanni]
MFADKYLITVCLLAFVLGSLATTPNMNNICALLPEKSKISAASCDSYYLCIGDVAQLQKCSGSQHFNKDTQQCLPADQVNCFDGTAEDPCNGRAVGTWAPVSDSCTDFYYCGANGAQRSSCPNGNHFHDGNQKCVHANQHPCTTVGTNNPDEPPVVSVNLCNYIQNSIYFGSPASCNFWNKCVNNVMTSGTCPTGFDYNVKISKCDFPTEFVCSQLTHDPLLTGAVGSGGSCSKKGIRKSAVACAGYYQCDGSVYQYYLCTKGQFYDTITQTCVSRQSARNNCDRCSGSKSQFVNQYSTTGCSGYLVCKNGVQQSKGNCSKGMFFNEDMGACVNQNPEFGCCYPKPAGNH